MGLARAQSGRRARFALGVAVATAALAAIPGESHAQTRWWVNGVASGNWNNPANWSAFQGGAGGAGVPGNADIARILHNNATHYNVTLEPGLTATVNGLLIGNSGTGTSTLTQNGAFSGITTNTFFGVGSSGGGGTAPKAVVNHSAGANTIGGFLQIGLDVGSVGTYNLSGTGQIFINNPSGGMRVGVLGAGTVNQTGGEVLLSAPLIIGYESGSSGTYNLGGTGVVGPTVLYVGYNNAAAGGTATGQFIQTGGAMGATEINVGGKSGASGSYHLSGADSQVTGSLVQVGVNIHNVSGNASGTFTQTGGTHTAIGELRVGVVAADNSATGVYNLGGGTLAAGTTLLGKYGTVGSGSAVGSFAQSGGTHTTGNLRLGDDAGTTGAYTLSGGSLAVADNVDVGDNGQGTFIHDGGTHSVGNGLFIGTSGSTGSGTYTLSGTALLDAASQTSVSETGVFTQNGGTHKIGTSGVASALGVSGAYNLNAGSVAVTGFTFVSNNGVLTQTGGTHTVSGDAKLVLGVNASSGTYNLSGTGSVTINGPVQMGFTDLVPGLETGSGTLNISGGTMTVTRSITLDGTLGTTTALNLAGGTLNAASIEGAVDRFNWTGGTLNWTGVDGLTLGGGGLSDVTLTPTKTLGVTGTLTIGGAGVLTLSGGGLNCGEMSLAGGTINGNGPFNNAEQITGFGTMSGSGTFANSGVLDVDGGTLILARTGTIANAGAIAVAGGAKLQLTGSNPANVGVISVATGGSITGTATINNNAGGIIAGAGTITTPLTNQAGGTILVQLGKLTVAQPLGNAGTINLAGPASTLAGGVITNSGVVRGDGIVNNAFINVAVGEIRAESGKTITLANMTVANAGRISLQGGAARFNLPLTNGAGGVISGRGTVDAAAGLANNGQVQFIGGLSDLYGTVVSNSGSKVIVSAAGTAIFHNDVTMNAGSEMRVGAGSNAVFFGTLSGGGAFTGSGTKIFETGASAPSAIATVDGDTIVQPAATLTTGHLRENAVTVDGLVTIAPDGGNAGTSRINELSIGDGGRFDLKNNKLILPGGDVGTFAGGAYSGLTGRIASAYNFSSWDGPGIATTMPDAGPTIGITTIAINTADDTFYAGGTFGGVPANSGDALIMYTYAGDVNFDGLVDAADYGVIDNWIQFPGTSGYANGDFNYDGVIDAADYGIIDNTIQLQGPPIPVNAASAAALMGVTAVPEPAACGFALSALAGLAARRRWRCHGGGRGLHPRL